MRYSIIFVDRALTAMGKLNLTRRAGKVKIKMDLLSLAQSVAISPAQR